jgi:hypothetical protein
MCQQAAEAAEAGGVKGKAKARGGMSGLFLGGGGKEAARQEEAAYGDEKSCES